MKRILLFALVVFSNNLFAQNTTIKEIEKRFTPSPTVSSLGTFGGNLDVKKSTGGITNSVKLFSVNEGDILYSPEIEYFSTGVRVNDWGGRLGISWTDNFTCMVSRIVKSVPDEGCTNRIDLPVDQMSQTSKENLQRVKQLSYSTAREGADGEYDEYNYDIFGETGKFIIKANQAVLLNHSKPVKIEIIGTGPLQFCITRSDGVKYYFGLSGEVERTSYVTENLCDDGSTLMQNVPTAWFISKIVSPSSHIISFKYDVTNTTYIYDERETFTAKLPYDSGDVGGCAEMGSLEASGTFCLRRKIAQTPLLTSVSANNFEINFQYSDRQDLPGDKLVKNITVKNSIHQIINEVDFAYDHKIATTQLEEKLSNELRDQTEDIDQIKHRYFLSDLRIGAAPGNQQYHFEYYNAELLPHHFSLSQDLFGYFNGKRNNGLLTGDKVFEYTNAHPIFAINGVNIATGNRQPDTVAKYGLLKKIVYPTKGSDLITYEANSVTTPVNSVTDTTILNVVYPKQNVDEWSYLQELFVIPMKQTITINVRPDYNSPQLPPDDDHELYYVEFMLYNITDETPVQIPGADANGYVSKYILSNYTGQVELDGGKEYQMLFKVHNFKTFFAYSVQYAINPQTTLVEKPFYGNRVSKIETISLNNPKQTRIYSYKNFTQDNNHLVYNANTSIQTPNEINGYAKSVLIEMWNDCQFPIANVPMYIRYHYFFSDNLYHSEIYNGISYTYDSVTEFQDVDKTSFIASQFRVASNEDGGVLLGDYTPFIPLSNPGWDNGIEAKRFYGSRQGNDYLIRKEIDWNYSVGTSSVNNNYVVTKAYDPISEQWTYPAQNFIPYAVIFVPQYSQWYKLNFVEEKNYENGGVISLRKNYTYNSVSKLTKTESYIDSRQNTIVTKFQHPQDMVDDGRDPSGIYGKMVTAYMHEPVIEQSKLINNQSVAVQRTNYFEPYANLYVPQSTESWINSESEKRTVLYKSYNSNGNILAIADSNGPTTNFIWSYGGEHPVAKIENANYSDVETILGKTNIEAFKNNVTPSLSSINSFINPIKQNALFKDAQITTCSYSPLIGMTSMTDTKGEVTTYEYDSFQRLRDVKDKDGNIVKHTDYHYAGQ